jgi:hypothetical protein
VGDVPADKVQAAEDDREDAAEVQAQGIEALVELREEPAPAEDGRGQ